MSVIRPIRGLVIPPVAQPFSSGSLPWDGGGGSAYDPRLLAFSAMQFSRNCVAGVDGPSSIAAVGANELRADGSGLYLIERYLPAGFQNQRNPAGAGWTAGTGTPGTAIDGPDGTAGTGYRYSAPSAGFGPYQSYFGGTLSGTFTLWRKAPSGTPTHQINVTDGVTGIADISAASTTWERRTIRYPSVPTIAPLAIPIEGRALGTTPPTSNLAQDVYFDLVQYDVTQYATSSVIASNGIRFADIATWDAYEVPTQLRSGLSRWRFKPIYSSGNMVSGDIKVLGSWGGSANTLRLRHTGGGGIKLECVVATVVTCASAAITWNALSTIVFKVDAAAGIITVESGVLTGSGAGPTGSAVVWPTDVFRLGGTYGESVAITSIDSTEIDAWISIPEAA